MKNRQKHIVLDIDTYESRDVLKLKIINGFTMESIVETLNIKTEWTPQSSDTLYFVSGCSVPRFKLKDRFKVTNKLSKATTIFVSDNEITDKKNLIVHKPVYNVNQFIEKYEYSNTAVDILKKDIIFMFENVSDYYINTNDRLHNYYLNQLNLARQLMSQDIPIYITEELRQCFFNYFGAYTLHQHLPFSYWTIKYYYKPYKNLTRIYELPQSSELFKTNAEIYLDREILSHVNEQNFVIDFDKYKEFVTMAKADDEENLILCMELMSNSDFDKSYPYLLFLIYQFGYKMKDLKEVEHVNFRSLINFLNLSHLNNLNIDYKKANLSLKAGNRYTPENVSMLNQLVSTGTITTNIV
jgi:hypothetical protein